MSMVHWMAALTVTLMLWSPPLACARDIPPVFMHQFKCECQFSNGTERVRFLARYIYNTEEDVHFDSDLGEFRALTELGRPDAEYWNQQKGFLEQMRTKVDTMCRSNYLGIGSLMMQRRAEPTVMVYPAKTQLLQHHNLLVCSVTGFYPGHVETMVMLEMVPQSGEVYSCRVEHPSLTSPVTVEWRAWSESAQGKMLSGIGGCVLGLLVLAVGLFISCRRQKEHSGRQPTGLLS